MSETIATGIASAAPGPGVRLLSAGQAAAVRDPLAKLASRSLSDNSFLDPAFLLPAVEHLAGKGVGVAFAAGGLAAAPFVRARLGHIAPAVRLWTHRYAPLGEPLVDRDAAARALDLLVEGLAPARSRFSLVFPDIRTDGRIAMALRDLAGRQGRPFALLGAHVRASLTLRDARFLRTSLPARRRKELARQMRRLGEMGPVTIESAVEPGQVRAAFEQFLSLEQAGWKGGRKTALASHEADAAFARAAVANLASKHRVRIDSLVVGGKPVAILVTFLAASTAFTWKIAYDEPYARFSPGAQLMLEAPARIFTEPGIVTIDSCATADHPMIDHLWQGRTAIATFVLGPTGGGVGYRLGLLAERAEFAARAVVRRLRRAR
jgi:CelD/BcsL family acetyltransferase involved in cellulose biosynthesis